MYDRERYLKNKESMKAASIKWRKENRERWNEYKKEWRHGKGKLKEKISKKKSDAKYHAKRKSEPEYLRKRREAATEYNNRPEVKEHRRIINAKRRARPEVKSRAAKYNKQYAKDNPDIILKNIRNHLKRIANINNIKWYELVDQLKGWSKIIHEDSNQTCIICGNPSTQAHHILHKAKYPTLAFNRNNGIALCDLCHNQVHGKMLD